MDFRPQHARYITGGCVLAGWLIGTLAGTITLAAEQREAKIHVLIIDGQNNHDWKSTTPILQSTLEECDRFTVDVATTPPADEKMTCFHPALNKYQVIVSNYNGEPWLPETQKEFESFVRGGGGFACIHAANNAFPAWDAYNEMIGLGGWGGRTESSGPYVFLNAEEELVRDESPGPGGNHGPQREFELVSRDPDHPIMKGIPQAFWHDQDELYDQLRGPAQNMQILATAYAAEADGGRDAHEPMVMTIDYGKGRVFHTALGHADYSLKCPAFVTLMQRGCEWAATGRVTIPVRKDIRTQPRTQAGAP